MALHPGQEVRGKPFSRVWLAAAVLAVVVCLIVVIQSTPSIRILLLIGTALFVIERTFGDWVADRLGPSRKGSSCWPSCFRANRHQAVGSTQLAVSGIHDHA